MLGQIYLELGDGVLAEKEFQKAKEHGQIGLEVGTLLLQAKLAQHRYDETIGALLTNARG